MSEESPAIYYFGKVWIISVNGKIEAGYHKRDDAVIVRDRYLKDSANKVKMTEVLIR